MRAARATTTDRGASRLKRGTWNKYGVKFSVIKDKSERPPRYLVFFKAKDQDAITQVMKEYTAKELNRLQKPSILQQLKKLKEAAVEIAGKIRHKEQEIDR